MKKPSANAITITVFGLLPIAIYWIGGGSFERLPTLAIAFGCAAAFLACAWGLWDSE